MEDAPARGRWWWSRTSPTVGPSFRARAPYSNTTGLGCTSGATLSGRATLGQEYNAPNTLDSCADGTSGTYHLDESIDSLSVSTLNGRPMSFGETVRVDARVWAYSGYSSGHQAIRAQFRYNGAPGACTSGSYNDRDDLVFTVEGRDRLLAEESLHVDQFLLSADGRWRLYLQGDGNLVLRDSAWNPIWSTKTDGHPDVWGVQMQEDGNLVLYSTSGQVLWASNTSGKGGTSLVMQNDANAVMYTPAGKAVWATHTCCR